MEDSDVEGGSVQHKSLNLVDNSNNNKNIVCGHLNVRSLKTGFDEFVNYVADYDFDILGLSETWLSPGDDSLSFKIPGYNLVRRDREGRGGGVGLYIKKYLNFTKVSFNDLCDEFEYVSVKFTINKKNISVTTTYSPPSYNTQAFLDFWKICLTFLCHFLIM